MQESIGTVYEKAYAALRKASLTLGDCSRFAEAIPVSDDLKIDYRSVMGVEIPTVEVSEQVTGVSSFGFFQTNSDVDEAWALFSKVKMLCARL